ncbi:hypothetical protein AUJ14_02450 [Candidatus Micrarchaeota archaeon CG1_02_55_22]|nr:MAG: hypothetical protein AUJ14_02450 [Candidatus Micrarchaeota archaeon CG1_02_55_22]
MKCNCGGEFKPTTRKTEEGIAYEALACNRCKEELLTMKQAKKLAKALENVYHTTVAKWGKSIAIRVPASVVRKQHLKAGQKAQVIPDEDNKGFRVQPETTTA